MEHYFIFNERLGIETPYIDEDWDEISVYTQQSILLKWEMIRGRIPDQIATLENTIRKKQNQLDNEEDFKISCLLNSDIAELASMINDLWLWYRVNQNISSSKAHV
ncbi:radical SAM protein [Ectobacillus polymachus]|uniref:radical SAM protein n=1 Tax=Ectobacillus polymachus TaxID=1508806 RepID=UPI003A8653A5